MMEHNFADACIAGVERLSAWTGLLDRINVFPVADGDTGSNLAVTLTPVRYFDNYETTIHRLLLSARGNSGNIASGFLSGFLKATSLADIPRYAREGRDAAYRAVREPKQGTMLTVFDALVEVFDTGVLGRDDWDEAITTALEDAVKSTPGHLPALREAGVVDSGALGIFIYLETFFVTLNGSKREYRSIPDAFRGYLDIDSSFTAVEEDGFCVDLVLEVDGSTDDLMERLEEFGEETVVIEEERFVKVHLHTSERNAVKERIAELGSIVGWSDDDLARQTREFVNAGAVNRKVHVVSDAAGSLTREDARVYGFTLLDSYITLGERSLPETHFSHDELYASMRRGMKASTSQASVFERHQCYRSALEVYENVLYLSVGSYFTGNFDVAAEWQEKHDRDGRFTVIDSTTASGRLGAIVLAVARYAKQQDDFERVTACARRAIEACDEYMFLEKLHYLAAGGRLSKSSAFFGDMLRMKPVISPMADGAKKVGVVRSSGEQLEFLREKLAAGLEQGTSPFVMLEYTDNKIWVEDNAKPLVLELFPGAEIKMQPLSLTTGVHTGPGTWGAAFLPEHVYNYGKE